MSLEIKTYKVKDFIRLNESGAIDFARSMEIIHNLAMAASFYSGHNILVDMRDTTLVGETDTPVYLLRVSGYEFRVKAFRSGPFNSQRATISDYWPLVTDH